MGIPNLSLRVRVEINGYKQRGCMWTAAEDALVLACDAEGLTAKEIARRVNRTPNAVAKRLWDLRGARHHHMPPSDEWGRPPNTVIIDRDKREAARDQRSLTQIFFGDPPPGYSALERRGR